MSELQLRDFVETAKLGQPVWEADPWGEKIVERCVVGITIYHTYDSCLRKATSVKTVVRVSGGFAGFGDELTVSNFGKQYFLERESARRACVEQSLALKAEKTQQLKAEIAKLKKELDEA